MQSQWLYESSVPSYFAAAVFAGNSVGGLAFYESAILLIAAVQWVQRYLLLPGVQLYVLFLLLDHLSKDDRLSHLAELVRTVIEWAMKSMTAAAIGFQVIQGLILPAVDGLKNTAVSRTVSAIPGIGNLFGSVTDTVLGSAVLLEECRRCVRDDRCSDALSGTGVPSGVLHTDL